MPRRIYLPASETAETPGSLEQEQHPKGKTISIEGPNPDGLRRDESSMQRFINAKDSGATGGPGLAFGAAFIFMQLMQKPPPPRLMHPRRPTSKALSEPALNSWACLSLIEVLLDGLAAGVGMREDSTGMVFLARQSVGGVGVCSVLWEEAEIFLLCCALEHRAKVKDPVEVRCRRPRLGGYRRRVMNGRMRELPRKLLQRIFLKMSFVLREGITRFSRLRLV